MKFLETTVKFLVVHSFAACQDIHSEVKYELFHLTLPTMKNRHSTWKDFWDLENNLCHSWVWNFNPSSESLVRLPVSIGDRRFTAHLGWSTSQVTAWSLVFGPTDPRILEVTITSREAVCCIEEPLTSNREITIEEIYAIFWRQLFSFWKTAFYYWVW